MSLNRNALEYGHPKIEQGEEMDQNKAIEDEMNSMVITFKKRLIPDYFRREEMLCIPCAVGSTDFKERAPSIIDLPFDGARSRAWIDDRSFELVSQLTEKIMCTRCGSDVQSAYYPEERLIA
jgi:hypothetical protein